MGKALYRKYRPTKLTEVVGEPQVTETLSNVLKKGAPSHAYLFVGPRGTGKTSVARIFAHEINGFSYEIEDDYVDIIEIDAASHTGVDNIRELIEKAIIVPTTGKYKVYIIDEIHMLSKSAFNALLKVLEEPPRHVVFIMATTDPQKVPETIKSRVQTYTFQLADKEVMLQHLKKIAENEKIEIEDAALKIVVERGGGSFRDSLSLLEQVANLAVKPITAEAVMTTFGLPREELVTDLLEAYTASDLSKITELLRAAFSANLRAEVLVEDLVRKIVKEPRVELLGLLGQLVEIKAPFVEAKLLVALSNAGSQVQVGANFGVKKPQIEAIRARSNSPQKTEVEPAKNESIKNVGDSAKKVPAGVAKDFDWDGFLDAVETENSSLARMLQNFDFRIDGKTLYLISPNAMNQKIVSGATRMEIIKHAVIGFTVVICDKKSAPGGQKRDSTIEQISAIMGDIEEVKNGEAEVF